VNYDGRDSDEVRRYIIDNALHWITEYHIDGLRLDAVHGIYDMGASHILKDITQAVHAQAAALGRTVQLIAESDLNDPRMVRAADEDGHGFDAQWADDLHHAVHSVLTGETGGYYADFGGLEPVAKALEHPFVYAGRYSAHRRRRHGSPATGISADHFIVCIQNHDQVGNRAAGERLSVLTDAAGLRLGAALYLLSPYVPMLWMGEEYGEKNPFQYFVSHGDEKLLGLVREGRRKEFESFGWGDDVPDPGATETFERSTLDLTSRTKPGHRELYALYRELLRARREEPALRPGGAEPHVAYNAEEGWITLELVASGDEGADLVVLFNLAKSEVGVPVATTKAGEWQTRLFTDDKQFGGTATVPKSLTTDGRKPATVKLPARSALLIRRGSK
jgi:maltooligosyltrehalose trehalohydrolase